MKKGFTLVELVIVIVIVGILSIVAVPIYKGYIEKARLTEGKATLAAIKVAQDIYFAEHGNYYGVDGVILQYDDALGVDTRANKYFKSFTTANFLTHGYARGYGDNGEHIVYDWVRPGSAPTSATINGITKTKPYMYFIDKDGTSDFI